MSDDWDDTPDADADDIESHRKQATFAARLKENTASGSLDDSPCYQCKEKVHFTQKITIGKDKIFHKNCLKCKVCDKVLAPGSYTSLEGQFFCKPHFKQTFQTKGNYSESFGIEDPKKKWTNKTSDE